MIALGTALSERGHQVTLETWSRWREPVEAAGMTFAAAPTYPVFPSRGRPLKPYEAAVLSAQETRPLVARTRPDVAVSDILTVTPALCAELESVPWATLIPHVHPAWAPGFPPYSFGARLPRTRFGRALWQRFERPLLGGLRQGRDQLNETRRRLGLPPVSHLHGGLSRELCLVGTFPQLEYPRSWPPRTRVTGPLLWEPPTGHVEPPPGDDPLVLVAPSTAHDREHRLLRAALAGLEDEPVRVLATWNRRLPADPVRVPDNARLVEWVSYARTMPRCAVVICHGGHGTVVRALASGCRVVAAPVAGDMNENAARLDWAGVGVRLPWRFATPAGVRLAVRRALGDEQMTERATALGRWAAAHDGAECAADAVEAFARRHRRASGADDVPFVT
jgi:UDP:flavonoid glycosyltransferase YjiC (YdhE family)